jgi:hypothetical protein
MNAQSKAGPAELSLVALLAIGVWWLVLGWNWDVVPAGTPNDLTSPHSTLDWVLVGVAVLLAGGWLGFRGRPIAAVLMVVVPLVALSAWRMAVAEVVGANLWAVGALVLLLAYGAVAAGGALLGLLVRRARARSHTE